MTNRDPGFGPQPDWIPLLIIGAVHALMGAALTAAGLWIAPLFIASGLVCLWICRKRYRQIQEETQLLSALPPTPRDELTARVLRALGATAGELAANARGEITPRQLLRLQDHARRPVRPDDPLRAIRALEGPVTLRDHHNRRGGSYELEIANRVFRQDRPNLLNAFKRGGVYRIYFVENKGGFLRRLDLIPISAEALADA